MIVLLAACSDTDTQTPNTIDSLQDPAAESQPAINFDNYQDILYWLVPLLNTTPLEETLAPLHRVENDQVYRLNEHSGLEGLSFQSLTEGVDVPHEGISKQIEFTCDAAAHWTYATRLLQSITVHHVYGTMVDEQATELDVSPPEHFQWNAGSVSVESGDGSILSIAPAADDPLSFDVTLSGVSGAIWHGWDENSRIVCGARLDTDCLHRGSWQPGITVFTSSVIDR